MQRLQLQHRDGFPSPPARPPLCQLIPGLLPLYRWCRMAGSPPNPRHLRVIPSREEGRVPFLPVLSWLGFALCLVGPEWILYHG